jgi:nucleoside-diphosphate-sugar epimerase
MKILVTGHRGFIGQNMVKSLNEDLHDVITHEWGDPFPNLKGVDLVIHLGAISSTTYKDVTQLLKQNYFFTVDLLEKCNESGIAFQFA